MSVPKLLRDIAAEPVPPESTLSNGVRDLQCSNLMKGAPSGPSSSSPLKGGGGGGGGGRALPFQVKSKK